MRNGDKGWQMKKKDKSLLVSFIWRFGENHNPFFSPSQSERPVRKCRSPIVKIPFKTISSKLFLSFPISLPPYEYTSRALAKWLNKQWMLITWDHKLNTLNSHITNDTKRYLKKLGISQWRRARRGFCGLPIWSHCWYSFLELKTWNFRDAKIGKQKRNKPHIKQVTANHTKFEQNKPINYKSRITFNTQTTQRSQRERDKEKETLFVW